MSLRGFQTVHHPLQTILHHRFDNSYWGKKLCFGQYSWSSIIHCHFNNTASLDLIKREQQIIYIYLWNIFTWITQRRLSIISSSWEPFYGASRTMVHKLTLPAIHVLYKKHLVKVNLISSLCSRNKQECKYSGKYEENCLCLNDISLYIELTHYRTP